MFLFCDGIELYKKGLHDTIAEAYYTTFVWNILAQHVYEHHLYLTVFRNKCAFSLGIVEGFAFEESRLFNYPKSLLKRKRNLPMVWLQYNQPEAL